MGDLKNKNKILELIKEDNPSNPLEYIRDIVKPMMLEKLNRAILGCNDCKKCYNCIRTIPYYNDVNASILIIGESVLEEQLKLNKKILYPYEGTTELKILKQIFNILNINTGHLIWANAINCFPHENINNKIIHRPPNTNEINNCKVFLNTLIEIVRPVFIILLGNVPMNIFKNGTIIKDRGQIFDIAGIPAMPIYSPEFLIQMKNINSEEISAEYNNTCIQDFQKAFEYIKENFGGNIFNNLEEEKGDM